MEEGTYILDSGGTRYKIQLDDLDLSLLPMQRLLKECSLVNRKPTEVPNYLSDEYIEFNIDDDSEGNEDDDEKTPKLNSLTGVNNSKVNNNNDINYIPCYICNMFVPGLFKEEHEKSKIHMLNYDIAKEGLNRINKNLQNQENTVSTNGINNSIYCVECNFTYSTKIKNHLGFPKHKQNLQKINLTEKFKDLYINNKFPTIGEKRTQTDNSDELLNSAKVQTVNTTETVELKETNAGIDTFSCNICDLKFLDKTSLEKHEWDRSHKKSKESTHPNLFNCGQNHEKKIEKTNDKRTAGSVTDKEYYITEKSVIGVPKYHWHGLQKIINNYGCMIKCCLCDVFLLCTIQYHIENSNHSKKIESSLVTAEGIREFNGASSFDFCMVCNQRLAMKNHHISSENHKIQLKKWTVMLLKEDGTFFCLPCETDVHNSSGYIMWHLSKKEHLEAEKQIIIKNVNEDTSKDKIENKTHKDDEAQFEKKEGIEQKHLPVLFYHCPICDTKVPNQVQSIIEHNNGKEHIRSVSEKQKNNELSNAIFNMDTNSTENVTAHCLPNEKLRNNTENDKIETKIHKDCNVIVQSKQEIFKPDNLPGPSYYYCSDCDTKVSNQSKDIHEHNYSEIHKLKVIEKQTKDERFMDKLRETEQNKDIIKNVVAKENDCVKETNNNTPSEASAKVNDNTYFCTICCVRVPNNEANISQHNKGKIHEANILKQQIKLEKQHVKEGVVNEKGKKPYHCVTCNIEIPNIPKIIKVHNDGSNHKANKKKSSSQIEKIATSKNEPNANGSRSKFEAKNTTANGLTATNDTQPTKFEYIVKKYDYYCNFCEEKLGAFDDIINHSANTGHQVNLIKKTFEQQPDKMASDIFTKTFYYYCEVCDKAIDDEANIVAHCEELTHKLAIILIKMNATKC